MVTAVVLPDSAGLRMRTAQLAANQRSEHAQRPTFPQMELAAVPTSTSVKAQDSVIAVAPPVSAEGPRLIVLPVARALLEHVRLVVLASHLTALAVARINTNVKAQALGIAVALRDIAEALQGIVQLDVKVVLVPVPRLISLQMGLAAAPISTSAKVAASEIAVVLQDFVEALRRIVRRAANRISAIARQRRPLQRLLVFPQTAPVGAARD